jgi:hypothetical protein
MNEHNAPDGDSQIFRFLDYEQTCRDCEVAVGQEHLTLPDQYDGCDVAICVVTGRQRLECGPDRDHDCGRDHWTGWIPGLLDCERLGWMHGPGLPDLARLYTEAVWDPKKRQWMKPT